MVSAPDFIQSKSKGYVPIHESTTGEHSTASKPNKILNFRTFSRALVVTFVLFSAAVTGLLIARGASYKSPASTTQPSCGNSSVEALERNCSFDLLTWAWLPPQCPHYTNDLFLAAESAEPWRYYEKLSSKQPIVKDKLFEAVDRLGGVWTEKREHLTHCVFMLLAQAQIRQDGTPYTRLIVEYSHLEHCANFLLESLRRDDEWYHVNTFSHGFHYDQTC